MPTCEVAVPWHLAGTGAVASLERQLRRWYGQPYALAVSSATTGLLGLGLALDLTGAEFVTTPYTWGGSIAAWLALGCRPVFADIDPRTLTLDPASVRARVTPHTRAILAVDIDGTPCDSEGLQRVADEFDLWYVLDGAQSLGATRRGASTGAGADAIVISFTVGKPLDACEGGAVMTRDESMHAKLVWHTQHPLRQARDVGLGLANEFALNGRIHPAAAAAADAQFDAALTNVYRRQSWALEITEALDASGLTDALRIPGDDECRPSFSRLSVALRSRTTPCEVEMYLERAGFGVNVTESPVTLLYRHPAFPASLDRIGSCPTAEDQHQRRVVLEASAGSRRPRRL